MFESGFMSACGFCEMESGEHKEYCAEAVGSMYEAGEEEEPEEEE